MRKASVHRGSGLSEDGSATTLPHADPRYASEPTTDAHTRLEICTDADPGLVPGLRLSD